MIPDDALLSCLIELSKLAGNPLSEEVILTGLPLTGQSLTIELFPRAAAHVELQAKLVNFTLKNKATQFAIPAVLILKNNNACLLKEITKNNTLRIIYPPDEKVYEIAISELQTSYTELAFLMEPTHQFTTQRNSVESENQNWFSRIVKKLWFSYSEVFIASFIINLFALALPLFVMNIYDKIIPNQTFDTLWIFASGIFLVFLFDLIMRLLRSYFIDQAGKVIDTQVSASVLKRIMGIKLSDRPGSIGALANTIQSFDSVREFITSTTISALIDLPFAIFFIILIGILGGPIVWVILVLLPLSIAFGFLIQRPLIELTKTAYRYASEKQAILFEILEAIEAVKTDCAENIMQTRWEQIINLSVKVNVKLRFITHISMFFSIFIQQLAIVSIIILGVYQISQHELTMGALVACSLLASLALAPMAKIPLLLMRYHQSRASLTSLNNVMTLPIEHQNNQTIFHISKLKGDITFHDVSYQYPSRPLPGLQNITFRINRGEHVAIIGRIGSGKTTLSKLMLKLLQPSRGTISFDGIDQSHLDVSELRRNIGYVPQDITLFHGSLRDNITFGTPNISDKNILRAIEVSGIDEFIKPTLGSYEAQISEGGKNLSGGQRRIIALARAVLLDPPIFVLDEPTHSMDHQTESIIKDKLAGYLQNKTLILMTHHLSLLPLVSRVIILDEGKILIDGPRDLVIQALSEGKIQIPGPNKF